MSALSEYKDFCETLVKIGNCIFVKIFEPTNWKPALNCLLLICCLFFIHFTSFYEYYIRDNYESILILFCTIGVGGQVRHYL